MNFPCLFVYSLALPPSPSCSTFKVQQLFPRLTAAINLCVAEHVTPSLTPTPYTGHTFPVSCVVAPSLIIYGQRRQQPQQQQQQQQQPPHSQRGKADIACLPQINSKYFQLTHTQLLCGAVCHVNDNNRSSNNNCAAV